MGLDAFLTIPGVKGSARVREAGGKIGLSGKIVVNGVSGGVLAKLDWTSGLPEKDENRHKPMVITKLLDNASPALHMALHKGTVWETATLEFWRMPPTGGEREQYFTIVMADVRVMAIKTLMLNNKRPENALVPAQEEVSLCYRFVHYRFVSGGKLGGTAGETKSEFSNTVLDVKFEIPVVAKAKEIAADFGKDAGKFFAGEVFDLIKGEEEKKK